MRSANDLPAARQGWEEGELRHKARVKARVKARGREHGRGCVRWFDYSTTVKCKSKTLARVQEQNTSLKKPMYRNRLRIHRLARTLWTALRAGLGPAGGAQVAPAPGPFLLAATLFVALGLPAAFERATPSLEAAWATHAAALKELPLLDRAHAVTAWGNQWLRYESDQARGAADDWASPLQSLARKAGDCEDYAILKYGLLRAAGVASSQVRLAYVMKQDAERLTPHMVALLLEPGQSWGTSTAWVLDNLTDEIFPLDRRVDLHPVLTLSEDGIWSSVEHGPPARPVAALRRWENLLAQMREEGSLNTSAASSSPALPPVPAPAPAPAAKPAP